MKLNKFMRLGASLMLLMTALALVAAVTQIDLTQQVKGVLPVANGGTGASSSTGSGNVVLATSPTLTTPTLNSPAFSGVVSTNVDYGTNAQIMEVPNAGTTGTTLNKLAKLTGAPSTAVIAATTDTNGMVGIVVGGAGTSLNAQIAMDGDASCIFDGGTTAGDFVAISSTTAGDCHDTGAGTFPTSGQVIGRVLSTNASAGTYSLTVFGPGVVGIGSSVSFADAEVPSGTINGVNTTFTLAHTPSGSSLQLYRNGQQLVGGGTDFSLATNTITFTTGQIPKTGDAIQAFYRF